MAVLMIISAGCKKKVEIEVAVPNDISRFIWNGMYDYYLWYRDVPNLSQDSYPENDDWYTYLNTFDTDYDALFDDLLYQKDVVDKWSWIVDDWEKQEQSFSGISKSMGYDFRLVLYGNDDVFGYIRYVLPGTPADIAGIERGDIFISVDGQGLNINNYYDLLFGQDDYQLGMAEIVSNIISPTGESIDLVAEVIQENPVFMAEVLDIGDGQATGYMVYNAFTSDFDAELNDAFGYFIGEGITRLILDLRYNGGGSIRTAVHMASMIYSTDDSKIFSHNTYNNKLQAYVIDQFGVDFVNEYFTDELDTTTISHTVMPGLPAINSLGLSEIYIIGTGSTASASELIINGLDPYINVILVGEKTTGKYVGSITVKDYYTYNTLNTEHKWALQPIVLKIANSAGVSDFVGGLIPDVDAEEDIADLKPFGDLDEPLLSAAISHILGTKSKGVDFMKEPVDYKDVAGSKDFIPYSKEMYIRYPEFRIEDFFPFSNFK